MLTDLTSKYVNTLLVIISGFIGFPHDPLLVLAGVTDLCRTFVHQTSHEPL
jgi:hypothetical protein